MKTTTCAALALCLAATAAVAADDTASQQAPARPTFAADGTVHVPAFDLPPSPFISEQALEQQRMRAMMPSLTEEGNLNIEQRRAALEAALAPKVAGMLKAYPVDIAEQTIGGIPTRVVTPQGRPFDQQRVLINLHGGAFSVCAGACALLESAPIASLGGYRVVTVDYRMAPESRHPAAVEDVAAVYRALLKSYDAASIGIYGCSAGGALTAQAAAWLPAHDLPQAGAVGIFGAGGVRMNSGDSAWIAAYIDGSFPAPAPPGQPDIDMTHGYFDGSDMRDASISPALHPEVMAQFPPALIITGTRAMDMSPAIVTNSALLKAGVDSTLIVGEGMGHCYVYSPQLPEAQDAYDETVKFFRKNLR